MDDDDEEDDHVVRVRVELTTWRGFPLGWPGELLVVKREIRNEFEMNRFWKRRGRPALPGSPHLRPLKV